MRSIPDDSIDMTFADPPFNLKKAYDHYEDDKEVNQYLAWSKGWLHEMVRVTKPTGSVFVHNIPKWLTFFASYLNQEAHFKHWIAWNAMGALSEKHCFQTIMEYSGMLNLKTSSFMIYVIRIQDVEYVMSYLPTMEEEKLDTSLWNSG